MWKLLLNLSLVPAVLLGGMLVVGCDASDARDSSDGRLNVVATVAMVGDVVRQVGGEKVQVTTLLGAGTDPHSYKPTRDDVVKLQNADIVFYSGLLLEGKMQETLEKLNQSKPAVAVTGAVAKDKLILAEGFHAGDPHLWMDASLWAQTAFLIADTLATRDPDNAAYYKQNAQAFADQANELYAYGQRVMETIPKDSRVLVTSHDAFNYFGRAYGIEVMGVQGISTESEANVRDINQLVDLLVERDVKAVFVESSVSPKNLQAVVEGAASRGKTVRIGGELFSDAMGEAGTYEGTYFGMIDHNITTVVHALGGQAPEKGWQGKLTK